MEVSSVPIKFTHHDLLYEGWATPSDKDKKDGTPKSFHVVLNLIFFGNLSLENGKWVIDEQRPHDLVEIVGRHLNEHILSN